MANQTLNTLCVEPVASRPYPGHSSDAALSNAQKREAACYMRVNHVGEVCAQALYHSQGFTAHSAATRLQMHSAAAEEIDHLAWCEQRLTELGGRKSLLNPLWYGGAFAIGALSGLAGDRWNLGLVAETEKQVVKHLENHLGKLPKEDLRSQQVVAQMQADEARHAEQAATAGAAPLPEPVRKLMRTAAKIMTNTAHYI